MIKIIKGNLLEANTEALVNTVNSSGVMGKGIALQFKQAFSSKYFDDYKRACREGRVELGKVSVFKQSFLETPRYIINFPTKKHWKEKSRIKDIENGLKHLVQIINEYDIKSIAIPPLGCGNGGLEWRDVKPLIEKHLAQLSEVEILLYSPSGAPKPSEMRVSSERPNMTPARAALLVLFEEYLLPGYRLSMLEVQKLAYFLQTAGEPLQLEFTKDQFGPYAEKLNHLLQRIEGHFIRGYGDRTQKVVEPTIDLIPSALFQAHDFVSNESHSTLKSLGLVSRLIEGFEYPHGMELLATVHWVATEDENHKDDIESIIYAVHSWSAKKKETFSAREIKIAWDRLKEQEWI